MPEFKRVRLINPRKTSSRSTRRRTRNARNSKGRFVKRSTAARRRNPVRRAKRRVRNVMGFVDSNGFHPIRSSGDYSARRAGESRRKKRVSRPRARARSKNPLGEELILLSNPRKKRKSRTTTRPRRRVATVNPYRRPRRRNPNRSHVRRQRRRNPEGAGAKSFAIEGVKAIAAGAVGTVGCRAIAQAILGDKNVGMMGYLANLTLALGGGFAIFKFTKSKTLALGWAVGGSAATVQRIWSEKVSMTSPAAAAPALGDLDYSSNGMGGVGLSGYVSTGYALPSVTGPDGTVQPAFQPQLPAVAAAAGSASQPSGVAQRYAPRY